MKKDWYCEDVLSGKIDIKKVWEDENVLAFHHPKPTAKTHVVIIPKKHIPSLLDPEALNGSLLVSLITAVRESAEKLNLTQNGFYVRSNINTPFVTPHMHMHLVSYEE